MRRECLLVCLLERSMYVWSDGKNTEEVGSRLFKTEDSRM